MSKFFLLLITVLLLLSCSQQKNLDQNQYLTDDYRESILILNTQIKSALDGLNENVYYNPHKMPIYQTATAIEAICSNMRNELYKLKSELDKPHNSTDKDVPEFLKEKGIENLNTLINDTRRQIINSLEKLKLVSEDTPIEGLIIADGKLEILQKNLTLKVSDLEEISLLFSNATSVEALLLLNKLETDLLISEFEAFIFLQELVNDPFEESHRNSTAVKMLSSKPSIYLGDTFNCEFMITKKSKDPFSLSSENDNVSIEENGSNYKSMVKTQKSGYQKFKLKASVKNTSGKIIDTLNQSFYFLVLPKQN